MPIKVMVIDDSALIRKFLTEVLNSDPEIEVTATAMNPVFALEKMGKGNVPDVITLDVEMPEMDGVTFLNHLTPKYSIPVIMFSSVTEKGAEITLDALSRGAFDFVTKPRGNILSSMEELKQQLIPKIKEAFAYQKRRKERRESRSYAPITPVVKPSAEARVSLGLRKDSKLVVIGSSTGGTQALESLITKMPAQFPPVLVVQHMPPKFTQNFANRLDQMSQMTVTEAQNGDRLESGHVYIAPGDYHMELKDRSTILIHQGERVNRHRPSVDPLFFSAARYWGKDALGVILTGMGNDGVAGMKAMKEVGSYNVAQDEETCVVFGMPKEAIRAGAVDSVLPIYEILDHLLRILA